MDTGYCFMSCAAFIISSHVVLRMLLLYDWPALAKDIRLATGLYTTICILLEILFLLISLKSIIF